MTLLRTALILGLLSAVGPFAIDMYLPAMPAIAAGLGTDPAAVQATLIAYFAAFGAGQLLYGPWSDQAGRKLPLYAGLCLFAAASVACALAQSIGWLIAARAAQGLGGAVLMIVPRAVIRDLHTGPEAAKLMATVMLMISISPMLAPLAGSGIVALGDWRAIFWVLALAAGGAWALTAFALPETLAPESRTRIDLASLRRGGARLLRDPIFMGLTLVGGFGFGSFMVFLASAAFVYTGQFGLSPTGFSLAFAVNAAAFFSGSQFARPLYARIGIPAVIRWASAAFALFAALTLLATLASPSLWAVMVGLFCANACLGLVIPTTMVMALDPHGEIAGHAASLGGTLQMLAGGVLVVLTGMFFDGTAVPMLAGIAASAALALAAALPTLRAMDRPQTA